MQSELHKKNKNKFIKVRSNMWMPRARLFHYVIIFHAASTNFNTIMSLFTFQFCTPLHSLDYEEWIMG